MAGGINCTTMERRFKARPKLDNCGNLTGWHVVIQTGRYYDITIPLKFKVENGMPVMEVSVKRLRSLTEAMSTDIQTELLLHRPHPSADRAAIEKAKEIAKHTKTVSVPYLQRQLSLSFQEASHVMDALELSGIIGPYDGHKHRVVLETAA